MRMRLIAMPDFAPDYARRREITFYDGLTLSLYQRVQARRSELLAAAHESLEEYFERMGLPDEDSFPYLGALTGEYYWDGSEAYSKGDWLGISTGERLWQVRVMLQARCLGIRPERSSMPADYCGVDVWLVFDPETGRFKEFYTGHKVI